MSWRDYRKITCGRRIEEGVRVLAIQNGVAIDTKEDLALISVKLLEELKEFYLRPIISRAAEIAQARGKRNREDEEQKKVSDENSALEVFVEINKSLGIEGSNKHFTTIANQEVAQQVIESNKVVEIESEDLSL